MLVYGDRSECADPCRKLADLSDALALLRSMQPGLDRHAKLVALLVDAGALLQGIADAGFSLCRADRRTPATDALTQFLVRLAREVMRSWDCKFESDLRLPDLPDLPGLPATVELREPEGFSFYAVYPEAYADAARKLRVEHPCVIGIRSIGTSLGAIVAAALNAEVFATVRPFGDPFARLIAVAPDLERELLSGARDYVIVDEGPGQSGSSFGAVGDWLCSRGVCPDRITFVTSHGGDPGPQASPSHERLWKSVKRSTAELDPFWLSRAFGPLRPLADGESLKFLGRHDGDTVLIKFAGTGAVGECKFAMAKALHTAGWTAKPLALAHGFLVEQWHEPARPLATGEKPLREIAAYIGTRAQLFPVADSDGASVEELLAMIRRNVDLAIGADALTELNRWTERAPSLAERVVRVRTDNRMDPAKWLRLPDGRLFKTDALDHHRAHDLIGAQDMAFDVAGATVEFDLDAREADWLASEAGRAAGRLIVPELLEFMTLAYFAFRLGQSQLAGNAAAAGRYERRLRKLLLEHSGPAIPRKSALGGHVERTGAGTIQS